MAKLYESLAKRNHGGCEHRVVEPVCDLRVLADELMYCLVDRHAFHFILTGETAKERTAELRGIFESHSLALRVHFLSTGCDPSNDEYCVSVVLQRLAPQSILPAHMSRDVAQLREEFSGLRAEFAALLREHNK